ncbi:MAG: hypothetical protein CTY20_07875 [Hyphomicrobium sp.]|nr:MAG: hypothetical protein CTY20_07875 [Hyphomicrobium sp.]
MEPIVFNMKGANLRHRKIGGSPYHVWADAEGNLLLMCESSHEGGRVFLPVTAVDAYKVLPCQGTKYIRFRNASVRFDEVCKLDDAPLGDPMTDKKGYQSAYIVGQRDFDERPGKIELPAYCGSSAEIPF